MVVLGKHLKVVVKLKYHNGPKVSTGQFSESLHVVMFVYLVWGGGGPFQLEHLCFYFQTQLDAVNIPCVWSCLHLASSVAD